LTIRDVQWSFTDISTQNYTSIVGAAGTYLCPNSLDTAPLSASLSENTPADTLLSASANTYRDMGGGERLWLVVDWIQAPLSNTSVDTQLITSASASLSAPVIMYDFGVVAIANLTGPTNYGKFVRQIAALPRSTAWLEYIGLQFVTAGSSATAGQAVAWIGWDVDSVDLGGASGFSIK
jgi:hypothetical protein